MSTALVWMRRDIRLHDHYALAQALKENDEVVIAFIFDTKILAKLPKTDRRITFIHDGLKELAVQLRKLNSDLILKFDDPLNAITQIVDDYNVTSLYFNRDYDPYAIARDKLVRKNLEKKGVIVKSYKDSVFFEQQEIINKKGEVYKVFTPYKRAWYEKFSYIYGGIIPNYRTSLKNFKSFTLKDSIATHDWHNKISQERCSAPLKGGTLEAKKHLKKFQRAIRDYERARDFPALEKTSQLSPYIRHGMISIRDLFRCALNEGTPGHQVWASELIWREFYQMILANYPSVQKKSFKPQYDNIEWTGTQKEFSHWKNGTTGFPLIDAAMRCLNETGFMHNRLRMVTASFLCKTLLVDWRKGEKYFAEKLLDFDLAANNGGWQWCASTGTDAQPYFRIFNPISQSEKFDSEGEFIRKWCPELEGFSSKRIHSPMSADMLEQNEAQCIIGKDYPFPIVDYKLNRQKALELYKGILKKD